MLSCNNNVMKGSTPLLADCQKYLSEVLGLRLGPVETADFTSVLPFFLVDAFSFARVVLLKEEIVLALDQRAEKSALSQVAAWLEQARKLIKLPVVYVVGSMASYERRRLIEAHVPFIVPGKQLFLPDLGVDLREHFRVASSPKREAVSPSTQALLIWHLLNRPGQAMWNLGSAAVELGYTAMTGSRALAEMTAAGIGEKMVVGRANYLRVSDSERATWEAALPSLRSPVAHRLALDRMPAERGVRLAGLSALSELSMLDGPPQPCFAVRSGAWMKDKQGQHLLPPGDLSGFEIQVWNYSTELEEGKTVDRLSLYLSLRDETDERVQIALEEMRGAMPW